MTSLYKTLLITVLPGPLLRERRCLSPLLTDHTSADTELMFFICICIQLEQEIKEYVSTTDKAAAQCKLQIL